LRTKTGRHLVEQPAMWPGPVAVSMAATCRCHWWSCCTARECSFGAAQMDAQQIAPSEYWGGSGRRPRRRPV